MDSHAELSGRTRVVAIVGDPIAQVKSPAGVTRTLLEAGRDAVCIPCHVAPPEIADFVRGVSVVQNLDGILVTVPHKFALYKHCATGTDRAHFLGAVNVMRRNDDGTWHGDQDDGEGFVQGIRTAGCKPEGARALLAGAGGAGSAIALALLEAGVSELAIHDGDAGRRDSLLDRLRGNYDAVVRPGSADPTGYSLVVNATPAGMRPADAHPFELDKLSSQMFVADVITAPEVTSLIEAARRLGCGTQVGTGMFAAVAELMVEFLLADGPLARSN